MLLRMAYFPSLLGSGLRALGVLPIPDGMQAAAALAKDMPFYAIKEKLAATGEEVVEHSHSHSQTRDHIRVLTRADTRMHQPIRGFR